MKLPDHHRLHEGSGDVENGFLTLDDCLIQPDCKVISEPQVPMSLDGIIVSFVQGDVLQPISGSGTDSWTQEIWTQTPMIDYQQPKEPTNNSILISLFSIIGFIIIASLVGFSFSTHPCSFERSNRTISSRNNCVNRLCESTSQINAPSTNDTTAAVEMVNLSDIPLRI